MGVENARRLRRGERGVTLLMVTVGMMSLLAMAVLAIDVVSLYVAKDQAQEAADAAALAGAEALASSGTTSAPSSLPLASVCNGSSGQADMWAQAIAAQIQIAGLPPTTVTTQCPSTAPDHNPYIQVTVSRTGMPTFFSRIWGGGAGAVMATARAEVYNPSFDPVNPGPFAPIEVQGVKPWLISNCNKCAGGPAYFTATYAIANGGAYIGTTVTLTMIASSSTPGTPAPNTAEFYAIDPPAPLVCPSNAAVSCNQIGTGPPGVFYHDNIACTGSFKFGNNQSIGPGQPIQIDGRSLGTLHTRTVNGTQCLIHAGASGVGQGQDSFTTGLPVVITGGSNNPNANLRNVIGIHRSDSVVTAPVFNCPPAGACDDTAQLEIVGFLELGIQEVTAAGDINAVILNAAGLDPASQPPSITGSGLSPIPVRLIQ